MGKRKVLIKAPNREKKWDKIFNALVKLSQNLQNDRQFLEGQIKSLHDVIYKMKMENKVESLKSELLLGLKEREAVVYKHRYENTKDDLADFREWFDYLLQKCSGITDVSNDVSNKGEGSRNKALQAEMRKLKNEIEQYKLEKNAEISAILAEKKFVWNQLKKLESNLSGQLKKKCNEVECANEKVQRLIMSNETLSADLTKMESESVQKSEEISKLMKEIELLKSRSGSASSSLHSCSTKSAMKKESRPSQIIEKTTTRTRQTAQKSTGGKDPAKQLTWEGRRSKRKEVNDIATPDNTPRLFSSSFKIPKLKTFSASPQIL
ncbi:hypothetical protein ACS0TY_013694 [Phlomoides rotata]